MEERIEKLEKENEALKTIVNQLLSHIVYGGYFDSFDFEELEKIKAELNRKKDTEFNHEAFYEFLLNVINPNEMEKYRNMFLSSGKKVKD